MILRFCGVLVIVFGVIFAVAAGRFAFAVAPVVLGVVMFAAGRRS